MATENVLAKAQLFLYYFLGWPSGIEPESEAPQASVLTVTPWPPMLSGTISALKCEIYSIVSPKTQFITLHTRYLRSTSRRQILQHLRNRWRVVSSYTTREDMAPALQ